MSEDHYDVVIVGSGPGGGSVAWRLARTGKRVLVVERSGYLSPRARELGHERGLPSIGAVNPTLTIAANALRVADIIAARLRCAAVP